MAKSVFDELFNAILDSEMPKVDNIMAYMAGEIQKDFVNETYRLLDIYYTNYTRPPRQYIRTDELKSSFTKSNRLRGKNGRFTKASETTAKRKSDTSLWEAMQNPGSFGVARRMENGHGYIGGVIFDEDEFNIGMEHSTITPGVFEEFDILNNFLLSDDASQKGNKAADYRNFPSAHSQLKNYESAYYSRLDRLYEDACRKFR